MFPLELRSLFLLLLLLLLGLLDSNNTLNVGSDFLGDGSPDLLGDSDMVLNENFLEVGIDLGGGVALVLEDVVELNEDLVQNKLRGLLLVKDGNYSMIDLIKGVRLRQ